MSSVIRGGDNFDSAGGAALKAWVNFNGTGTVAIRASYNVSSITDNGTGDYTVNFTNALQDANYCVSGSAIIGSNTTPSALSGAGNYSQSTTALRFQTFQVGGGGIDCTHVHVSVFR